MALIDQRHTVRLPLQDHLERGVDSTISAPIYLDGALVAPDADGTVSVYDANNTAVVDAQTVTISGSIASYVVTAATTASLTLGESWRVEWDLYITASSTSLTPVNDAALVRRILRPAISDVDLHRRVPALDPTDNAPITSFDNYQDFLDEAWTMISDRLIRKGERPYLVMSPGSLREAHLQLTLGLIYDDLVVRAENPDYDTSATRAHKRYELAWGAISFVYDRDRDGRPDIGEDGTAKRRGQPPVFLSARR